MESCEIKSGSGLGTRLGYQYTYTLRSSPSHWQAASRTMDQVCLLMFLFSGIFLIDRVHGADKTPDTFFKVTANATCGEKGKTQIQCFTGTTCCEDKDGNAVGCMNSGQICCQGEYTAKVCDYGSKCCLDDIGRLVGCASENEKCCAGQICTVGETCCNNEQGKPYKCAAVGYTCCPTSIVTVCSPGLVCCKNSGGKPCNWLC